MPWELGFVAPADLYDAHHPIVLLDAALVALFMADICEQEEGEEGGNSRGSRYPLGERRGEWRGAVVGEQWEGIGVSSRHTGRGEEEG